MRGLSGYRGVQETLILQKPGYILLELHRDALDVRVKPGVMRAVIGVVHGTAWEHFN